MKRELALGDLAIFLDQQGNCFHSAVYVADDVLFTKNGTSFSHPWMYMRMDEMKEFYPRPGTITVRFYRPNDLWCNDQADEALLAGVTP